MLYVALVFGLAWVVDEGFKAGTSANLLKSEATTILSVTAGVLVLIILMVGESMARSRAGLMMTIAALLGAIAMMLVDRRNSAAVFPRRMLVAATAIAFIIAVQFALYGILERFGDDPLADGRIRFAHNTIRAAMAFLPTGTGLGTFVPVYGMFEPTVDIIENKYVNHAHNDFLEFWLETGALGIGLLTVFFIWFGRRALTIWRRSTAANREIDLCLMRAATLVITFLALHSLVDYPLRTSAIAAMAAFACALLVDPLRTNETEGRHVNSAVGKEISRNRTSRDATTASTAPRRAFSLSREADVAANPTRQAGARWGEDIEWPEEWRKATGSNGDKPGKG